MASAADCSLALDGSWLLLASPTVYLFLSLKYSLLHVDRVPELYTLLFLVLQIRQSHAQVPQHSRQPSSHLSLLISSLETLSPVFTHVGTFGQMTLTWIPSLDLLDLDTSIEI
jgi:hypothetical protein